MNDDLKNQLHTIIERAVRESIDAVRSNVIGALNEPSEWEPWVPGTPPWSDSPKVKRGLPPKARKKPGPKPGSKRKAKATKKAKAKAVKTTKPATPRAGTQVANILEVLHGDPLRQASLKAIKTMVSGSDLALDKAVQSMVKSGQIKRVKPGLYELP